MQNQSINQCAESALQLIKEHDLSAYPQIYAVFFEYFRGSNKKLIAEMQPVINRREIISEKMVEAWHSKYIGSEFDKKILEESGQRVQSIMADVLRAIDSSAGESKTFTTDLDKFSKDLETTKQGGITDIVGKLLQKTREFKTKGETLQQKLEQSKAEVDVLKSTLHEASTQLMVDALSGVANRKAFDETIAKFTNLAKTESRQLCLLMVDIDHFKRFNDTFGHLIGDQVIKIVAAAMKEMVKGKDFVARYGGEEFAVLLMDTPIKGGQIVAESIRSNIATRELKRKDSGESFGQITVSIGLTMFDPVRDTVDGFIDRADKALYSAKKSGRNRVSTEDGI